MLLLPPLVGNDVSLLPFLKEQVYVSTEDPEIAEIATSVGAAVLPRRADLAGDDVPLTAVMEHALQVVPLLPARACLLMPNCPLREARDISASARRFQGSNAAVTMSVVAYDWRAPQWALREENGRLIPAAWHTAPKPTDRPERLVCPSGAIRWVAVEDFLRAPTFYPVRLTGYEMPWHRAIDIDEPADLEMAECVAHALDHGFAFADHPGP